MSRADRNPFACTTASPTPKVTKPVPALTAVGYSWLTRRRYRGRCDRPKDEKIEAVAIEQVKFL